MTEPSSILVHEGLVISTFLFLFLKLMMIILREDF